MYFYYAISTRSKLDEHDRGLVRRPSSNRVAEGHFLPHLCLPMSFEPFSRCVIIKPRERVSLRMYKGNAD